MNPSFQLVDRDWDKIIKEAASADRSELRVVCPFIKVQAAKRLLTGQRPDSIRVITRFHIGEMCDGVNDTEALRLLLEHGAKIRGIRNLHAKLYLFGSKRAIVTSANLTEAAFFRNHEFGFVSNENGIIERCREYFDALWNRAGGDLNLTQLEGWENRIKAVRVAGSRPSTNSGLSDEGVNAGLVIPGVGLTPSVAEAPQSFVKFFGEGHHRASLDLAVLDEVKRSGCHWACTYPRNKRPRRVEDGAVLFMGRLMENPKDIIVYGRAIGLRHVPGRDEASAAEIALRGWKATWPIYVRVHHAEFVAGTLGNGVSLSALMGELRSDSFAATQRNASNGTGNTDPRKAYQQQAAVQLTKEAFAWLNHRLELAFVKHGKLTPAELETLDWPQVQLPNPSPPAHLSRFQRWLVASDGKTEGTAKVYASFLLRCTEHYGEIISDRTVCKEIDAQRIIDRVDHVVAERGRWAKGTFNTHDITDNFTPALRAYLRFIEATFPVTMR
jgi:hypothetical protein